MLHVLDGGGILPRLAVSPTIPDLWCIVAHSVGRRTRLPEQGEARDEIYFLGRLSSADGRHVYRYDVSGLRVASTDTVTGENRHYHYDAAGHLIGESSGGGTWLVDYVWLGDRLLARVENGGEQRWPPFLGQIGGLNKVEAMGSCSLYRNSIHLTVPS